MDDDNVYAPPASELGQAQASEASYELASRWARLGGAIVDSLIAAVVTFPVMYLSGAWDRIVNDGSISLFDTVWLALSGFVIFVAINGYLLTKSGQTIGKKAAGTRIVSVRDGSILPLWKVVLLRYLPVSVVANLPIVGQFLLLIDDLFIFSKSKRCVHDHIAGTRVIKAVA